MLNWMKAERVEIRKRTNRPSLVFPSERVAGVVDLLHVAFRARRADDVPGLGDPVLEPPEALAAHPLGQHRHPPAAENPRDRDAAPAVVPGRRPDGAVAGRIE